MAEQHHVTNPDARTASLVLSFAAGYVDSCTFLALFGLFVAQVTGSFVAVGAQIARGKHAFFLPLFGIPIFVLAGAATTLLVAFAEGRRRSALAWCLALEAALLTGFLLAGLAGFPFEFRGAPLEVVAGVLGLCAMGVQSATVQLLMRGTPSTNVMTTNTTQLSILATQAVLYWHVRRTTPDDPRGSRLASTADRVLNVLYVAGGFLIGTIAGAFAFSAVDVWCVLVPIGLILSLMVWAIRSPAGTVARS